MRPAGTAAGRVPTCPWWPLLRTAERRAGRASSRLFTAGASADGRSGAPAHGLFPWVVWGFRTHDEVANHVVPQVARTMELMKRIPFADIEMQLEQRGMDIAQFKEGAVHAYRFVAECVSSRPEALGEVGETVPGDSRTKDEATNTAEHAGSDDEGDHPFGRGDSSWVGAAMDAADSGPDRFEELSECVDEHLLRALRLQREQHIRDNWRVQINPGYIRATPLAALIAPSQPVGVDLSATSARGLFGGTARLLALGTSFAGSAMGRPGCGFALLIDCHFEVQENIVYSDATTGKILRIESNERDHVWTFMTEGLWQEEEAEANFSVRDMNYFVSNAGIVTSCSTRHLH